MKLRDIKNFLDIYDQKNISELEELSEDIRNYLIEYVNNNYGHIGSNLSVLELTIALLSKFNLNNSIVLFDTGHQSHIYKLLTNRKDDFDNLKKINGYSNFQEISESQFDFISTGHSSTSLSYAYGYSLLNYKENIITVIGDAAFYTGYCHAGLLNLIKSKNKTITIVNDNREAIGENSLNIQDKKLYVTSLGFEYIKCDDGHDFEKIFLALDQAKQSKKHVIVWINTIKANKYNGLKELTFNHTVEKNNLETYSYLVPKLLENYFTNNDFLISPAMIYASNFYNLKQKFLNNVIDVGINEEVAGLVSSSLANANKKVFLAMHSTFFQRTFDQLVHDIFRNKLNLNILIDRSGLNYSGGVSHHGIYDISLISNFENSIISHPYDLNDLQNLIYLMYNNKKNVFVLRYENTDCIKTNNKNKFEIGQWDELIFNKEYKKTLLSYGSCLEEFKKIILNNNLKINLINARFIKPIDKNILEKHKDNEIFIYEQVINKNNLSVNIENYLNKKLKSFCFESNTICHGQKEKLLEKIKMSYKYIIDIINGDD